LSEQPTQMRWDPYHLFADQEFDAFWRGHLRARERKLLIVLGRGFDLRALEATNRIMEVGASPDVWLLRFDNGLQDSELRSAMTQQNVQKLEALCGADRIFTLDIRIGGPAVGNATSNSTRRAIMRAGSFEAYDDVVVDISAMPRMVALTTIAKMIHDLDEIERVTGRSINLHVVTAESVSADLRSQRGTLSEDVTTVVGFSGHLTAQGTENVPRVWFPVLGENQTDRLIRIRENLDPDEICPVVPFPSREPRRGDEIIDQHRQVLFDDFQAEPRNILRASEYNPFEAYKQLFAAMDRYRRALHELGGCKAFVSPVSSKLLSVGALLACYDHLHGTVSGNRLMVGIPYVETAIYGDPVIDGEIQTELYAMWIRGEWEN
jgi:hypothetical protein